MALKVRRTCLILAVGTWTNGTLTGPAKVIFEDKSMLIGNFRNGFPVGFIRKFGQNNNDLNELFYEDLMEKGRSWILKDNYLIWKNTAFVQEEDPFAVLIPLDKTEKVLTGTLNLPLGLIENIYGATFEVTSPSDYCSINLKWAPTEKKKFKLIFTDKKVIKFPMTNETQQNCKIGQPKMPASVEDQFLAWGKSMYSNVSEYYNGGMYNLFQLRPDNSPVENEQACSLFISSLKLYLDVRTIKANISIWNGPIHDWQADTITIDTKGQLHGACVFQLNPEFYNQTGEHEVLHWSPKVFFGKFHHGSLDGVVLIVTWKGEFIYASFKDGVMHGPAYSAGVVNIYSMEVSYVFVLVRTSRQCRT